MLAASNEGEYFLVEVQKILHRQDSKVTHSRNLKIPENQVLTQGKVWDTKESVQEACTENGNPQVINRNTITRNKMENHLIAAFSAVLGLSVKIVHSHFDCSQLSHSREHSSHCFQHLLHSPQGPVVFILRSHCLYDHQITGSACGFQNAILSSKYSNNCKV